MDIKLLITYALVVLTAFSITSPVILLMKLRTTDELSLYFIIPFASWMIFSLLKLFTTSNVLTTSKPLRCVGSVAIILTTVLTTKFPNLRNLFTRTLRRT